MKMRKTATIMAAATGLALGLGLAAPQTARANTIYSYIVQPQGGSVTPGQNNTLNLYLQEVSTTGSFTAASDGGLLGAGVSLVEQAGGTGVTFSSTGQTNNNAAVPAGFGNGPSSSGLLTNGGAWLLDELDPSANTGMAPTSTTTSGGTTTSLFLLGSTTVAVGSNPNATFQVVSFKNTPTGDGNVHAGQDGNTLTTNFNDLDAGTYPGGTAATGADANPTTFSIASPVPEPASMALFAVGAVGLLARRRRRSA
jgi:hypothetical protein